MRTTQIGQRKLAAVQGRFAQRNRPFEAALGEEAHRKVITPGNADRADPDNRIQPLQDISVPGGLSFMNDVSPRSRIVLSSVILLGAPGRQILEICG
jgi:hypothetical protein